MGVKYIKELTEEQKARRQEYYELGVKIGLCTDPADRTRAEWGIREAYACADLAPPKEIVWVDSPMAMAIEGPTRDAKLRGVPKEKWPEEIRANFNRYIGGQFWVGGWWWNGPISVRFLREVCDLELDPKIARAADANRAIVESCCWIWPHTEFCVATERPRAIHLDNATPVRRLHNPNGKAIEWPDGWGFYAIHGVRVPGWIIETPERITIESIDAEANVEVRRVMIERFGYQRYLGVGGAELVHEDRFGKLWKRPRKGDSDVMLVEVVNSTPESDGTYKTYFMRVRPTMTTAHAAVASTFPVINPDGTKRLRLPHEYFPEMET